MSQAVQAVQTMTSLEIVDMINKERMQIELNGGKKFVGLRHDNFMSKVVSVLGEEGALKFKASYLTPQNKEVAMYSFPKREATLMAMSYSPAISAAVYDKMTELEQQVASQSPKLPNFSNPAEAARAWALEYERSEQLALVVEQKEVLLLEQAPKVDFVDQFVEADGALGIQAASRLLRMNMRELSHWLVDEKLCFGIPRIAQGRDSFVPAIAYHIFKSGTQDILSNSAHTSV
ncbi:phage antirepressor KilAC domain-containing protein [Pseudomonas veronii]|uniref:phage antirepressor KilAC domain-containing protein n=1 Tax=Pseudomonas veronii TaxID=76761 RepID=UPI00159FF5FC|nr:phage antirepressor KilAC domain-containing protein [Pseudomonas veronii]NWC59522.1 phage antirepressor KilAC domain-containing protein [Pseudomonas veronii]